MSFYKDQSSAGSVVVKNNSQQIDFCQNTSHLSFILKQQAIFSLARIYSVYVKINQNLKDYAKFQDLSVNRAALLRTYQSRQCVSQYYGRVDVYKQNYQLNRLKMMQFGSDSQFSLQMIGNHKKKSFILLIDQRKAGEPLRSSVIIIGKNLVLFLEQKGPQTYRNFLDIIYLNVRQYYNNRVLVKKSMHQKQNPIYSQMNPYKVYQLVLVNVRSDRSHSQICAISGQTHSKIIFIFSVFVSLRIVGLQLQVLNSQIFRKYRLKANMLSKTKKTMAQSTTPTEFQREHDFDQSDFYLHYLKDGTYLIDHKTLPFIFRFNYAALQKVRLSKSSKVPKIAHDIFYYVKDKLLVGRYSQGGRFPNRMKYEQKVKFVMRAFEHTYSQVTKKQFPRNEHYNRQSQIKFFSREEVRENFLEEIQKALKKKKAENQRKILHFERHIETAIQLGHTQPQVAEKIFKDKIQRRQLPWTDNMFMDISDFSRILYTRYCILDVEAQKKILQMQYFETGEWQVARILKEKKGNYSSIKQEMQDFHEKDEFQLESAD